MGRSFGSRTLLATSIALALLLAGLAVVQYRWSTRVAAADAQREREHLDSGAALFASEFNGLLGQAMEFLQGDAWSALQSGERLAAVPKPIGELYYLNIPVEGAPEARQLTAEGRFSAVPVPKWMEVPRCAPMAIEQPPALIAPVYDIGLARSTHESEVRVVARYGRQPEGCFVARLDESWLRQTVPQMIGRSFGVTEASEYDFAVISHNRPEQVIYGAPVRADLRKRFFSMPATRLRVSKSSETPAPGVTHETVVVSRTESTVMIRGSARLAELFGPGIWELDVAHKGIPLAEAFEQRRRRDLTIGLGVESLLLLAIVFLVAGARHMQRLANQKMAFVAGVSHELRTPVSAIAMLSRNQADGLVAGAERVKQYGELIHQQSRRLNEMVEQTLQYAGIHSGLKRPSRHEVDLRTLIQEAVDARRAELAAAGFEVEIAVPTGLPAVMGDAPLLRTALDNLLSNAHKYSGGGRWIRISASHHAAEKEVWISVEDRGTGIDPADQAEIFEPFARGRAAIDAQIPGSGLGLSLVRSAAEAHHGTVTLVSEAGRGSTFTMRLPV